jgi:hypothetical protein
MTIEKDAEHLANLLIAGLEARINKEVWDGIIDCQSKLAEAEKQLKLADELAKYSEIILEENDESISGYCPVKDAYDAYRAAREKK